MKIEKDKFIAFKIDDELWDKIAKSYANEWMTANQADDILKTYEHHKAYEFRYTMMKTYQYNTGEYFYMSNGAMEVCDRIKMTKFDLTQLAKLRRETSTILLDERHFFRYMCADGQILVLFMELQDRDGHDYYKWTTFRIDTVTGEHNDGGAPHVFDKFLRLMCFIELGTPELITLGDGHRIGTKKAGKIFNKSGFDVILVRSDWNKIYIKNGFHVSGHWRWQHYGPNGEDLKLIFIEEFVKDGYTRTIKK
jgi:hypothetical protein